jgi:glucose-6-phosphate dehydrogenase assembly protein OpcA
VSPPGGQETPRPGGARDVDVADLDRVLGQLWKEQAGDDVGVTRACMSNLIVYCRADECGGIPGELAEVVKRHPSRVLHLVERDDDSDLRADVTAVCHLGGSGSPICSEHVTLTGGSRGVRRMPATVRSLLIGDLPTALWWASNEAPAGAGGLFGELAGMVNQVIYDSVGWTDPVRGVLSTADWVRGGADRHFISDLAWRRAKPFRRLLAETLDPELQPGALAGITRVSVEHTPHALPQSWLLIGWLSHLLGWEPSRGQVDPGVEIDWSFRSDHGPVDVSVHRLAEGEPEIRSIEVAWEADGERDAARFRSASEGHVACELSSGRCPTRHLTRPRQDRPYLVVRQLQKLFRDPLFEATLAVARTMAEPLAR